MLYEFLMDYAYNNSELKHECGCGETCSHPIGMCPSNQRCYKCLNEIYRHYPNGPSIERTSYNCKKLVNQYVYRSLDRYSSEIIYALESFNKYKIFDEYNILSLGCGPSTDLVAIDYYNKTHKINKLINYYGIDIESSWGHIHQLINDYSSNDDYINNIVFEYGDILRVLETNRIPKIQFNVIIFQYLISSLNSNGELGRINELFDKLAKLFLRNNINDAIIIINDINRSDRGRNTFLNLIEVFKDNKINIVDFKQRYFKNKRYGDKSGDIYGIPYEDNKTLLESRYDPPVFRNNDCVSAQLIVNIGE